LLRTRETTQRGESLVELALVSFLLVLLLVGVIDFGRAFNSYEVITNASREGARYASRLPHDRDGIVAAAQDETEGTSVTLEDADIAVEPELVGDPFVWSDAQRGEPITVTVSYDFPTILGDIVGADSLTLRARTVMVVFWIDG
jgi:Flp pilus assembly protein TadG